MFYKTALLSAVSVSFLWPVSAQTTSDEPTTLDTIIVEGSRLDQTATEIGSAVSIITATDLKELGFGYAVDAVASAPGVTVNQNGAFGGSASVRIRGASSEQTLVLIDGIVVNDPTSPGGGFNFARVDTENIERIEVLKGPQSTLWGTDAIGGVVSITTKRPDHGFGGSAFAEYGSFNTFRGGASLENANDHGDFRLSLVASSSDGISKADENNGNDEEDSYEALTLSAKAGLNLGGDTRLIADVYWTDADSEFDSFNSSRQGNVGDGDELSETEELSANLALTGSLFDGQLENLLLIGYSDIMRENFSNGTSSFAAEGDRMTYRYQGTLGIDGRNKLAFGIEREESTSRSDDTVIDGLFALYEFKPTDTITLTGGLRRDDHERFGAETTGRLAAAYNPNEQVTLRASWGQGFKAPTIFQTTFFCCGAVAPNADLAAETSEAFDIGVDYRSADGRYDAGLTVFDQDTENLITFSFAVGGYENVAEVRSQGVELYGGVNVNDWLRISANFAYIDAEDGDGTELVRVPQNSGDVRFAFDPEGPFSGAMLLRYNDVERDANGKTEDWTRVNLTGNYDLNEQIELFGRIENLFDEEYQQILGYGTPGLSGSIGIRLRY